MDHERNSALIELAADHFRCVAEIVNEMGLHARPASLFVTIANRHACDVTVAVCGDDRSLPRETGIGGRSLALEAGANLVAVDGKSILELLSLSAECGSTLLLETRGRGALEAIEELRDLVRRGFGDAPSDSNSAAVDAPTNADEQKH